MSRRMLKSFNASQRGFTLIELLIAASLLAVILVVAERSISGATRSGELSERRAQSLNELDRLWVLMENDFRNIVAHVKVQQFQEPLPALSIAPTEYYRIMLLRAGQANPLSLPRSEVLRVAYRFEEDTLWRDSWIDPYNPLEETARSQKLLGNIEELTITALPRKAEGGRSVSGGPWLDQWPSTNQFNATLPLAVEVRFTAEGMGEVSRLFGLVPGA